MLRSSEAAVSARNPWPSTLALSSVVMQNAVIPACTLKHVCAKTMITLIRSYSEEKEKW